MAKIITSPHDKLFRGVMHDTDNASGFLKLYMDAKALEPLDLSTLTLKNSNFLDKNLSESISDLVYSCEYDDKSLGSARVIIMVEHQSTPDKLMPFRVYHYLFNMLAYELKNNNDIDLLPAVHALVFYHGEQTPYPFSMKLSKCFNDPYNIMDGFLNNPIPLIDVNEYEDEALLSQHIEGMMSVALKHGRDKEIGVLLMRIITAMLDIDLDEHIRLQFAEQLSNYLFSVGTVANKTHFIKELAQLPNSMRDTMMTFADELRNEGRTEGRVEGLVEGRVEGVESVAINALKQGMVVDTIAQLTGLSVERIAQIKQEQGL